jgi:predicted nucleic acid-binding protein
MDVSIHTLLERHKTVVDTQSVLDWLYFADPRTQAWEASRLAGGWQWLASPEMRDELAHVLGRGHLPVTGRSVEQVLADMDARVSWQALPVLGEGQRLRCSDRDDQKFIDAAIGWQACWLVSRDKAVLKLGRRAQRLCGLHILRPTDWTPDTPFTA